MKCCEQEVTTKYCPHCGTLHETHGLETLLEHCRFQLAETRVEFVNDVNTRQAEAPDDWEEQKARFDRLCVKWTAWIKEIETAIENQN